MNFREEQVEKDCVEILKQLKQLNKFAARQLKHETNEISGSKFYYN